MFSDFFIYLFPILVRRPAAPQLLNTMFDFDTSTDLTAHQISNTQIGYSSKYFNYPLIWNRGKKTHAKPNAWLHISNQYLANCIHTLNVFFNINRCRKIVLGQAQSRSKIAEGWQNHIPFILESFIRYVNIASIISQYYFARYNIRNKILVTGAAIQSKSSANMKGNITKRIGTVVFKKYSLNVFGFDWKRRTGKNSLNWK